MTPRRLRVLGGAAEEQPQVGQLPDSPQRLVQGQEAIRRVPGDGVQGGLGGPAVQGESKGPGRAVEVPRGPAEVPDRQVNGPLVVHGHGVRRHLLE